MHCKSETPHQRIQLIVAASGALVALEVLIRFRVAHHRPVSCHFMSLSVSCSQKSLPERPSDIHSWAELWSSHTLSIRLSATPAKLKPPSRCIPLIYIERMCKKHKILHGANRSQSEMATYTKR